jgi:sialate O-acetylesterase
MMKCRGVGVLLLCAIGAVSVRAEVSLPHVLSDHMAVTIDVGNPDDVHPLDKLSVGHRLALAARATVFGESIEDSGPVLMDVARDGGSPSSFEVAGADGVFKPATAQIQQDVIIVKSEQVPQPHAVRYGWSNSPVCTIDNGAGLPASPFKAVIP